MNESIVTDFIESNNLAIKPGDLVQLTRERSAYTAITYSNDINDIKFFSISPNDVCVILDLGFTTNNIGVNSHFCLVRGQVVKTVQGIFELV